MSNYYAMLMNLDHIALCCYKLIELQMSLGTICAIENIGRTAVKTLL